MSRLIVLSNRVKMPDNNPMAGGLAIALHDLLRANSGIWMGWNGDITDNEDGYLANDFSNSSQPVLTHTEQQCDDKPPITTTVTYVTTALTAQQYQHFYCGFANNVLWPLLHERNDLIQQAPEDYSGYQAVNQIFARQLKKFIQPDDVIWVHDYHFLSVAYHCRQLGMRNRIGFFLHIPFAPLAFWQPLAQSAELIHHLAHYDVLGVQTQRDKAQAATVFEYYLKDHILKNSATEFLLAQQPFARPHPAIRFKLNLDSELANPHYLTLNAYAIGVDAAKIQQQVSQSFTHLLSSATALSDKQNHAAIKTAKQRIIAVDRIDYSKGLLSRFSAYRTFLQHYPNYQNQLQFLQIACPSRLDLPIYQQLHGEVRQAIHDINQQFSPANANAVALQTRDCKTINGAASPIKTDNILKKNKLIEPWQAVTYSESALNHDALMSALCQSDIGWVNSLKDGMNLVAKEYIAAQNPDNPGVLLLSRYAGAAEQMEEAVIIDPLQPDSIIHGLKTALTMPLAERKSRYETLFQGLEQHNLHTWQQDFLKDLHHCSHKI